MRNSDSVLVMRLKQSVAAWNSWFHKYQPVQVNLIGANLTGCNLTKAYLREVFLTGALFRGALLNKADLRGANLLGAYLWETSLVGADLRGANLTGANLTGADLTEALLLGADLRGANLTGADLTGADLRDVYMDSAVLSETVFADVDLREINDLEQCWHDGPSTIDMRTLRKSWPLPLTFLRGCGLDDSYIEYLPSLIGHPIQFYSCFISYSSRDEEFVKRLHADLQDKGVRCWFAPEDMKTGDRIRHTIDEAIRLRDKLLLVLSEKSIESNWVETEIETALEEEKERDMTVLFPVRIDDAVMETRKPWARQLKTTRHIGDFRGWKNHDQYQEALNRLLRDLRTGEV